MVPKDKGGPLPSFRNDRGGDADAPVVAFGEGSFGSVNPAFLSFRSSPGAAAGSTIASSGNLDPFLLVEKGLIEGGSSHEEAEGEAGLLKGGTSRDLKGDRVPTKPIPIPILPQWTRLDRGILCIEKQRAV